MNRKMQSEPILGLKNQSQFWAWQVNFRHGAAMCLSSLPNVLEGKIEQGPCNVILIFVAQNANNATLSHLIFMKTAARHNHTWSIIRTLGKALVNARSSGCERERERSFFFRLVSTSAKMSEITLALALIQSWNISGFFQFFSFFPSFQKFQL